MTLDETVAEDAKLSDRGERSTSYRLKQRYHVVHVSFSSP